MKYVFLLIVVLIVFVIWRKINARKTEEQFVDEVEEPKVSFLSIKKADVLEERSKNNLLFDFEISSMTKKNNTLDILITIYNHSDKTIRIDLKEAIYESFSTKEQLKADVTFYGELSMGTNDILLKNTILPELQVIRNIYFFKTNLHQFHQNDALTIDLMVNNQPYQLVKSIHQSKLESIKVIA